MEFKLSYWFCCVPLHIFALILGSIYILLSITILTKRTENIIHEVYYIERDKFHEMALTSMIYAFLLGATGVLLISGSFKVNIKNPKHFLLFVEKF